MTDESKHPDHRAQLNRIRRIRGQLDGIERMIAERRYCPDILSQTRAISSAIRGLESTLLESHIRHCVKDALVSPDEEAAESKLSELLEIFSKRLPR